MSFLNNLRTGVKLIGSFLIIAVITAVVGVLGIYYIKQIDAADTRLYQNQTVPLGQIADAAVAFQRTRVNLRDMILAADTAEAQKYADTIKTLDEQIVTLSADYEKLIVAPEMRALFDDYTKDYAEFKGYRDTIMALALAGKQDEALTTLRGDAFASAKAVETALDAMQVMKTEQAKALADENTATANQATTIMIIIVVGAALLGVGFGVIISNSIANPLAFLTKLAKALSVGDMVRDVSEAEKDTVRKRKDEIGDISNAFDALINYMQGMGVSATAISENDLTTTVTPKSPKDELGNSFAKMIAGLRDAVSQIAEGANSVSIAASQLTTAAEQSRRSHQPDRHHHSTGRARHRPADRRRHQDLRLRRADGTRH
ncbi:MCP four helix bundle domain-containing protein [Candidatus Villigracilis saccharophilus]|uniref:MCP four helix bundle domain-containing protein n=1 Tax=Candidatus Villigracilis saccharophilus TaxID=3140684 RepID=UPI00313579D3|nr:MCP four helix bundle domain-containing protein [Anaerolineales bacterium]